MEQNSISYSTYIISGHGNNKVIIRITNSQSQITERQVETFAFSKNDLYAKF